VNYEPVPVDTSTITLDSELAQLVERLAENVHDLWAQRRMSQGWTWGEQRDDAQKKHPGLVPYRELPEKEKDYDRATAVSTLKLIMTLGFRIERREPDR